MCPVYLDIESRLDRRAVEATAREITQVFSRLGGTISQDLTRSLGRGFSAFDTSAARNELVRLENAWRRAANTEVDAMYRMQTAAARAAEASVRYGENSAKTMGAQALAAKGQRDYADAIYGAEAAHRAHTDAIKDSAAATSAASRVFNGAGLISVGALGVALDEATKAAGNFQQAQTRLVASGGETVQNLKAVSDGILQLSSQVGIGSQKLMQSMFDVEKAGYRGADGVNVLKAAAQGSISEQSDLQEVLKGVTTSMNDFNYGADQAADVMSKLVQASALARTNFQDFSGALPAAEPLIANIGKSQGLNPDQMHHLMADLYGLGAQMTQTGDSAQHSFELIGHAASKLLGPTSEMRSMMGALGLDGQDVTDKLGERGVAGTLQYLQQALQDHTKDGMVDLNVHYQSAQAARAEAEAFDALPGPAKAVAQQIKDGAISYTEWRKSRGGLNREMANEVGQWDAINSKLTGYSDLIKSGIGDHISYDQALKILTGDQETMRTALQASGENMEAVNDKIKKVYGTVRDGNGDVMGFNDASRTLNSQMAQAKATFGDAAIQIGGQFVPVMTDAAHVAKDVGEFLGQHPGITHAAVDALKGLSGAWLAFKGIDIAGAVLKPIAEGLGGIIAGEEGATAWAGRLSGAMSTIGRGAGLAIGAQLGGQALQDATAGDSFWNGAAVVGTDAATGAALGASIASIVPGVGTAIGAGAGALIGGGAGLFNQLTSHAGGGPLRASGPRGHDSALFWGC